MKFFKVGDRVSCYKGNGTIVDITMGSFLPSAYYVELDNGGGGFFMRWSLEHLKEESANDGTENA